MSVSEREMACRELVEAITGYLEGALSPADEARFEAHLEACSGCRMYLGQFRATIAALGELPRESLSPEAERQFLEAFRDWRQGRP